MTTESRRIPQAYFLHVNRPGSDVVDTYRQTAISPIAAIMATQEEFQYRNGEVLPVENIVLVATEYHLEHGVS
jgi:hypothetical protein